SKPDIAEPLLRQSLDIVKKIPTPRRTSSYFNPLVCSMVNLTECLIAGKKYPEASEISDMLIYISKTDNNINSSEKAQCYLTRGMLSYARGKLDEAEPNLQTALRMLEESLAPDDPQVAFVRSHLGTLCLLQGKLKDARSHIQNSLDVVEKAF